MALNWIEIEGILASKEWVAYANKVRCSFSSYSKRLRFTIGNKITYGNAETIDEAKIECAVIEDKLRNVKTMNQLLKIV